MISIEITPPSGAIHIPPHIVDINPPTPAPIIVEAMTLTGSLATYGIAPSVIPKQPVIQVAAAGFLSSLENF